MDNRYDFNDGYNATSCNKQTLCLYRKHTNSTLSVTYEGCNYDEACEMAIDEYPSWIILTEYP